MAAARVQQFGSRSRAPPSRTAAGGGVRGGEGSLSLVSDLPGWGDPQEKHIGFHHELGEATL